MLCPLAAVAALLVSAAPVAQAAQAGQAGQPGQPGPAATAALPTVALADLVAAGPRGLEPSSHARALGGQRIRLVGHMAHLEEAPDGAFYLTPRPVECDEGGGGTADLPPETVRVVVRSAVGAPVRWLPGPVEVTGRFQVGAEADGEGQVAWFRLLLDQPEDLGAVLATAPAGSP